MQRDQNSTISNITEPSNYVAIDEMTLNQINDKLKEIEESIADIKEKLEKLEKEKQNKINSLAQKTKKKEKQEEDILTILHNNIRGDNDKDLK